MRLKLKPMQKNCSIINDVLEFVVNPPKYTGYVYVISLNEFTKIGMSEKPLLRIGSIQTSTPYKVKLELIIPSLEMARLEKSLHCIFSRKRHSGEWFILNEADIAFLKTLVPVGFRYKKTYDELMLDSPF